MRENKAAQVLSHPVAAVVCCIDAALAKLLVETFHTAEFIETVDGLFDTFNSRSFRNTKKMSLVT